MKLLSDSQLSVTRIAGLCGFGSLTRFGDTFKREVSATPLAYRRVQSNRRVSSGASDKTARKK